MITKTMARKVIVKRLTAPRPMTAFYVRVGPKSRLSVRVEVFRTTTEFRAAVRAENESLGLKHYRTRRLIGECVGVSCYRGHKQKRRLTGCFAWVRFPKKYLTMSTITHELFHATVRWAERVGLEAIPTGHQDGPTNMEPGNRVDNIEERCASIHDYLCRAVVVQLNKRLLIER